MYNFKVLNQIKEELNLKLLQNYDETKKYIGKTKFEIKCTYEGCDENITIEFVALLRSKKAYCTKHRYNSVGDKTKKTSADKNKIKLYNFIEELHIELVGDYYNIDIKNNTDICYKCIYDNCNQIGTKQFQTLLSNKKAYCNYHNKSINENLRNQNQERYNDILDKFKNKYPQVNLTWNRNSIWSQAELKFN
jgi:hypothetical protein